MAVGPMEVVGLLLLVVLFVVPLFVGYQVGARRGHANIGLLLALLLSWIGVGIIWLMPKKEPAADTASVGSAAEPPVSEPARAAATRYCPACGTPVEIGARFCAACGEPQPGAATS